MMRLPSLIGIVVLLTQHTLCQAFSRDEYTADRKFYKINLNLTTIPTDIPDDALEVHIQNNTISKIEANVFANLSQCTRLNLSRNGINEVEPGAFNGLIAMKRLDIGYNRIKALHVNMFSDLENCTFLIVQHTQIREIEPGTFNGLSTLYFIALNSNRLRTLTTSTFQGLVVVSIMFLFGNEIMSIETNTFAHLENLQMLWLNENGLQTIEPGTFSGLRSLRLLYLQYNYLETLTADSFSGLESLQELHLEGNRLTLLSADVFSPLPRPLRLSLHDPFRSFSVDNPLQCTADLCWLKQEELQGKIMWYFQGRNLPHKPTCVNGKEWDSWHCEVKVIPTERPISSTNKTNEELEASVRPTVTTTTEQTVTTETQHKDNNRKRVSIALGISGMLFIVSIIIVVICFRRHCATVCCAKRRVKLEDTLGLGIVNREEPMATEPDVGYAHLPANPYETIGEPQSLYHGQLEVTQYENPAPLPDDMYDGHVKVTAYNDPVPDPFNTRL